MPRTNILASPKLINKFCVRENKLFGCKQAYMCTVTCPLWRAMQVQYLMFEKNLSLGEAHRLTVREALSKKQERDIIKGLVQPKKEYPERTKEEIVRNNEEANGH